MVSINSIIVLFLKQKQQRTVSHRSKNNYFKSYGGTI